jgi:hypothetical protein
MKELLFIRAAPNTVVETLQKEFNYEPVFSVQRIAVQLSRLYLTVRDIAIRCYFFYSDTLRRLLIETGAIKEVSKLPVNKGDLIQLSTDFNHVLNLYTASEKRMP